MSKKQKNWQFILCNEKYFIGETTKMDANSKIDMMINLTNELMK
jgi:hypothetical protein